MRIWLLTFLGFLAGCTHAPTRLAGEPQWMSNGRAFTSMDLDGDKALGHEEFIDAMTDLYAYMDRNGNRRIDSTEALSSPQWIKGSASNGNKTISIMKFLAAADAAFATADIDKKKKELSEKELSSLRPMPLSANAFANESRVCVGNVSDESLTWRMKTNGGRTAASRPDQAKYWACATVPANQSLQLQISSMVAPYSTSNCYTNVVAGEWVEVVKQGKGVACQVFSDGGANRIATVAPFGTMGEAMVRGIAQYEGPIKGATLRLVGADGTVIVEKENATDGGGNFELALPARPPASLRLEISGGSANGDRSETLLSAWTENYDHLKRPVTVNALSTIVADTLRIKEMTQLAQVEAEIRNALALPETPSLETLVEDRSGQHFNVGLFADFAERTGGLNEYVRTLNEDMRRNQVSPQSFAVKPNDKAVRQIASPTAAK